MIKRLISVTLYKEKSVYGVTYEPINDADYYGILGVLRDFCNKLRELKIITDFYIHATKGDQK